MSWRTKEILTSRLSEHKLALVESDVGCVENREIRKCISLSRSVV